MIEISEQEIQIVPKNSLTKELYEKNLKYFCDAMKTNTKEILALGRKEPHRLEHAIMHYIKSMEGKISTSTINSRYTALKYFLTTNDIILNYNKIQKVLPSVEYAPDRLPTDEEIETIKEHLHHRGKTVLRLLMESGMRIGALPLLKLSDFQRVDSEVCKIIAYRGTKDQYVTFCSMKTFEMVKKLGTTPLFAKNTRYILTNATKHLGKREFSSNHWTRKWFKSRAEASGCKSLIVETLLGHSTGVTNHYYRPSEKELVEGYKQIIGSLHSTQTVDVQQLVADELNKLLESGEFLLVPNDSPLINKEELKKIQSKGKEGKEKAYAKEA